MKALSFKVNATESLFHYTKTIDSLSSILRVGFRYGYCFEEHSKRIAKGEDWTLLDGVNLIGAKEPTYGIATPMICFCDIPIIGADEHRAVYGDYCIGLNKEIVRKEPTINPLLYTSSAWVYSAIEKLVEYIPTKDEIIAHTESISNIIGNEPDPIKGAALIKKALDDGRLSKDIRFDSDFISAINTLVSLVKGYDGEKGVYYNEHEWRAYFTAAGWPKRGITRQQFDDSKDTLNNDLWNNPNYSNLTFDRQEEVITYIVVPTEDEISKIAGLIRDSNTILGCELSANADIKEKQKGILISKITSFDRIEVNL
jgi:hypothetical protein